jgi:superfamily II DNA or RNA helicase
MSEALSLFFSQGSVLAAGLPEGVEGIDGLTWDERTKQWRAPAYRYREIVLDAEARNIPRKDECRAYDKCEFRLRSPIQPRPDQAAALDAWLKNSGRGTVCLPTGAGKTILAVMTIAKVSRPTLVVVPTIDLMHQWISTLERFFEVEVGAIGGGLHKITKLTVATYDSACIHMERIGSQFGYIVFDEVHHLPAPQYQMAAIASIAPFRLGLSATVERSDGKEEVIFDLVGPLVYEARIGEMVDTVLSPYDVVSIEVDLSNAEREDYTRNRSTYLDFVKRHRIQMSGPEGWVDFIRKAAYLPNGRDAMKAFRCQKRIAQCATAKLEALWQIIQKHRDERIIIFTAENQMAYKIGSRFVVAVITHHTKPAERRTMLEAFRQGKIRILVTSKVLNEGVDVPEASVAVVVSGSGVVREHVQRLGRILRHQPGKRATMYELITSDTNERFINQRRKRHDAYQRIP